ncbi:MAG: hypothetical protein DRP97_04010 [Candidatus Latescibacterota bacterium]|nr:HEAT repeat domain-containing protein [Candidatus Latescibacterota bacterium]RKY70275.1 MAG: hypothetical protein DRP97_04010 [Candidatus Latescibacterota bacterium]
MANKVKNPEDGMERNIGKLVEELKKYDGMSDSTKLKGKRKKIRDKLVSIGGPAVPALIQTLNRRKWQSSWLAASALGEIGDERAIGPLADVLEDPELGENAKNALKAFGPSCIPEVIERIEYRIRNPITEGTGIDHITAYALSVLGEIKCEESITFLNKLLDEYMTEIPDESFDPTKRDWKYRNVDFFKLLDCMVKQQDKRAIPHIRKARDFFPEEYVDHKICQIAMGRIKKGRVEGYLPMEALEISIPSGAIMNALSGGELGWEDTFEEQYGEYFEDDEH